MLSSTIELRNGVHLPRVGLGTFKSAGQDVATAVTSALQSGIRHIDTAAIYKNEMLVHSAVLQSGIDRRSIFVTSKVSPYTQGAVKAAKACEEMLSNLGGDYVDLVLIHWPGASKTDASSPRNAELRLETWRVLEHYYKQGRFRAIGVSNFEVHHLEQLLQQAVVPPMVNQFEVHPRRPCAQLRALCAQHNIAVVGYASLGCGQLLDDPTVQQVAAQTGMSPAQVLLRWSLQHDVAVIPKSVHPSRIAEFAPELLLSQAAALSQEQMQALDSLEDGHKYCWDPSGIA